jgi:hypothetical protein
MLIITAMEEGSQLAWHQISSKKEGETFVLPKIRLFKSDPLDGDEIFDVAPCGHIRLVPINFGQGGCAQENKRGHLSSGVWNIAGITARALQEGFGIGKIRSKTFRCAGGHGKIKSESVRFCRA